MTRHYAITYALLFTIVLVSALGAGLMNRTAFLPTVVVGFVAAAIFPVVAIWLMRKMGYPIGQKQHCPRCAAELPLLRQPANTRQALFGGYRCPKCGADIDARGRERH